MRPTQKNVVVVVVVIVVAVVLLVCVVVVVVVVFVVVSGFHFDTMRAKINDCSAARANQPPGIGPALAAEPIAAASAMTSFGICWIFNVSLRAFSASGSPTELPDAEKTPSRRPWSS